MKEEIKEACPRGSSDHVMGQVADVRYPFRDERLMHFVRKPPKGRKNDRRRGYGGRGETLLSGVDRPHEEERKNGEFRVMKKIGIHVEGYRWGTYAGKDERQDEVGEEWSPISEELRQPIFP